MGKSPLALHLSRHVSVPWTQRCSGIQTHACIRAAAGAHTDSPVGQDKTLRPHRRPVCETEECVGRMCAEQKKKASVTKSREKTREGDKISRRGGH